MSEQLQLRRGTAANVAASTGAQGEVFVDTTNNRLVVQDGATAGGFAAAKLSEVVAQGVAITLPAGTATVPPLKLTSGSNLTTPAAGAIEYDGAAFYATVAANERCVLTAEQIQVLSSPYTLTSTTSAQQMLNATANGALTLAAGTYEFESMFSLSSMSATSGAFGFALGGTATFTQAWQSLGKMGSPAVSGATQTTFNTTANTAVATAGTSGSGNAFIKGIIRVTAAGTIIPQVSLTVAAAAVVGANSYFKATPIGGATMTNVGNWS